MLHFDSRSGQTEMNGKSSTQHGSSASCRTSDGTNGGTNDGGSKRSSSSPKQLVALGQPLPPRTPHAVSVSLPTWSDNVGYEEGHERVVAAMRSGYPRFVFNPLVKKLFDHCRDRFAMLDEDCLACRTFIRERALAEQIAQVAQITQITQRHRPAPPAIKIRIAELLLTPQSHIHRSPDTVPAGLDAAFDRSITHPVLHIVLFPAHLFPIAKQFWQHTGEGISSRFAEHCLRTLEIPIIAPGSPLSLSPAGTERGKSKRYSTGPYSSQVLERFLSALHTDAAAHELNTFVEERFGRNLNVRIADGVKVTLRKRIAGVMGDMDPTRRMSMSLAGVASDSDAADACSPTRSDGPGFFDEHQTVGQCEQQLQSAKAIPERGVPGVSEDDVFLFPCGMSTIYNIHRVILRLRPGIKSVQFGFPYIDTLKIQERFGPGCHFLGRGDSADLDALERLLDSEPISAIICEFPSNPLLRSPDLRRLYSLAHKHNTLVIVDETIGNFVNVCVLPFADIIVSSLTKVFSGDSNVMGGSAVLNPASPFCASIKAAMGEVYMDTLWCEDAIFLERNSRTFVQRCQIINRNAERLCDYLRDHPKVEAVYYPKYVDSDIYTSHARQPASPGYGGLFSLILRSDDAAIRFYDAVQIYKGPSLGTNFTLACPYTILAHYTELDWAASYGVPKRLIRISVGAEDTDALLALFESAMEAA
ncbi:pyridoxal phosphate-dependent transferase [Entophlyctis helioformis]|nr:pyridoxal phosphate-dependent transferase [Entophlyctis helioformis]